MRKIASIALTLLMVASLCLVAIGTASAASSDVQPAAEGTYRYYFQVPDDSWLEHNDSIGFYYWSPEENAPWPGVAAQVIETEAGTFYYGDAPVETPYVIFNSFPQESDPNYEGEGYIKRQSENINVEWPVEPGDDDNFPEGLPSYDGMIWCVELDDSGELPTNDLSGEPVYKGRFYYFDPKTGEISENPIETKPAEVAKITVGGKTYEVPVGETFTLTTAIKGNDRDICAYNVSVYYDRSMLSVDKDASLFPAVGNLNDKGEREAVTKLCNYDAVDDNGEELISYNGFVSTGQIIDLAEDNRLGVFTFTVTKPGECDLSVVIEELLGEDENGDNVDVTYDQDAIAVLEYTPTETTTEEGPSASTTGEDPSSTTGDASGTTAATGSAGSTKGGSSGGGTVKTDGSTVVAIAFVAVLMVAAGAVVVGKKRSH